MRPIHTAKPMSISPTSLHNHHSITRVLIFCQRLGGGSKCSQMLRNSLRQSSSSLSIIPEFMIFSFRFHQELAAKQKPPDHHGRRFATSPAEILFGEFPRRTSAGTFVPALGTVGSPLPGCQTRFRSHS